MPVMSTQVLMRTTALVDAPLGDKPMTWNSGMCTERDAAREKEKWSKRQCQQNCRVHTKYPHSFWGICNTICCRSCAIYFMILNYFMPHPVVINTPQNNLLTCLFQTWAACSWYENKLGATTAAQSSVFLVGWVTLAYLEACGGVMQRNTFGENTR